MPNGVKSKKAKFPYMNSENYHIEEEFGKIDYAYYLWSNYLDKSMTILEDSHNRWHEEANRKQVSI